MTPSELERRLHDYVDGELDAKECAAFEEVLADDAALRDEVDAMRDLIAAAQELPSTMTPPRDMWGDLHAQIESGEADCRISSTHRQWFRQPSLWAAAVLLMIAGSATYVMTQSGAIPQLSPNQVLAILVNQDSTVTDTVVASFQEEESAYLALGQELRIAVEQQKRELPADLMLVIDENLNIIDSAIEEMRVEYARDPGDERLAAQILGLYERQLALLQKARSLSSAS